MRRRATKRRWGRRLALVGFGVVGLLLAVGILNGGHTDEDIGKRPDNMAVQDGWATPEHNPVLPAGSLRPQALWNDPSVVKDGARYVMYMTTSVEAPFKPPILPFRAVSPDGLAWTLDPATPVASAAGTRFVSIETPSVVRFQGQWHMYFTGIYPEGGPAPMAIGHAVSADGRSWVVTPGPVLSATGQARDWNGVLVGEPGALVRGDRVFVYFSALAARSGSGPPQDQSIGLAITTDGEHFAPPAKVLALGPTYPIEKGFAGYSAPSAFELAGKVHLLYDVVLSRTADRPPWQQVALHHAVSTTDGTGSFVQDDRPIFTRNSFPMSHGEVIGPAALIDGALLKLWFGAHVPVGDLGPLIRRGFSGDEFGIYYATRPVAAFK